MEGILKSNNKTKSSKANDFSPGSFLEYASTILIVIVSRNSSLKSFRRRV
jgi:hypothetical protein